MALQELSKELKELGFSVKISDMTKIKLPPDCKFPDGVLHIVNSIKDYDINNVTIMLGCWNRIVKYSVYIKSVLKVLQKEFKDAGKTIVPSSSNICTTPYDKERASVQSTVDHLKKVIDEFDVILLHESAYIHRVKTYTTMEYNILLFKQNVDQFTNLELIDNKPNVIIGRVIKLGELSSDLKGRLYPHRSKLGHYCFLPEDISRCMGAIIRPNPIPCNSVVKQIAKWFVSLDVLPLKIMPNNYYVIRKIGNTFKHTFSINNDMTEEQINHLTVLMLQKANLTSLNVLIFTTNGKSNLITLISNPERTNILLHDHFAKIISVDFKVIISEDVDYEYKKTCTSIEQQHQIVRDIKSKKPFMVAIKQQMDDMEHVYYTLYNSSLSKM